MTEVAEIYLGNIDRNDKLAQQIAKAKEANTILEVFLTKSDRAKGRIFTHSTKAIAVGIVKSRDLKLEEGDVFQTTEGNLLLIHLKAETLMVLNLTSAIDSNSLMKLVRLGHLLGNQHYPIKIEGAKIYVPIDTNSKVITTSIKKLNIPNLTISWEENLLETEFMASNHHH